jgi:hypothetical protein
MTTPDYCIQHGYQKFLDIDKVLYCPVCYPKLREPKPTRLATLKKQVEQLQKERTQLVWAILSVKPFKPETYVVVPSPRFSMFVCWISESGIPENFIDIDYHEQVSAEYAMLSRQRLDDRWYAFECAVKDAKQKQANR